MAAIAASAIARISDFPLDNLAAMAWSFALRAYLDRPLRDATAAQSLSLISEFATALDLSSTAWSFAALAVLSIPLFDSIAAASRPPCKHFKAYELINTAWAFAFRDVADTPLCDSTAASSLPRLTSPHSFQPQQRANFAWA